MRRMLVCLTVLCLMTGCSQGAGAEELYWQQEISHLYPSDIRTEETSGTAQQTGTETVTDEIQAIWVPVMQYGDWMTGKEESQFRENVREAFAKMAALGINTVFLHVRAYGDAYYDSSLFPKGAYLTADYDPLKIMTEEARKQGLSPHAWINPMRLQTAENLARSDAQYPLRQWHDDPAYNGTRLVNVDGRYWLNPAYPEVRQLIADGAAEIVDKYDVDGIHIDDYFYPTQDASFDAAAFAESGASDLAQWRRENTNAMVKLLYDTVKAQDPSLIFSISPQGNMVTDHDTLYADAALWGSEQGYADWLVPQIYYGYENAACPFTETLTLWKNKTDAAKLIIGLAPYKIGAEDMWAGAGSQEWLTDAEVLSKETAQSLAQADGVAFYSYASLFAPEPSAETLVAQERERIRKLLTE